MLRADTRCRLPQSWGGFPRRCMRRRCVGCAKLLVGEQRRKLAGALGVVGSQLTLATVTGPGQDVLPWDTRYCRHAPGAKHDGRNGCRVKAHYAWAWNAYAAEQLRQLHRLANRRAQRVARQRGVWWGMVAKVWQLQERGVLHAHLVLPWGCPGERAATRAYVQALEALAPRYGFGYVDNHLRAGPREGPGWKGYLSRYLAKDAGQLAELPMHALYVHRELAAYADCSIRRQRERRRRWAASRRAGPVVRHLQAQRARLDSELRGMHRQLKLDGRRTRPDGLADGSPELRTRRRGSVAPDGAAAPPPYRPPARPPPPAPVVSD